MPDIERLPWHSQAERTNIANLRRKRPCPSRLHHQHPSAVRHGALQRWPTATRAAMAWAMIGIGQSPLWWPR